MLFFINSDFHHRLLRAILPAQSCTVSVNGLRRKENSRIGSAKPIQQGLKPNVLIGFSGTTEVVP